VGRRQQYVPKLRPQLVHIFFTAVDFFNQINMLYGTITEFCTEESCPIMSAGPKYEYHWADGHTVKKPIKCSAPKYIDYLMTWVQDQLDDETLFPSKIGNYDSPPDRDPMYMCPFQVSHSPKTSSQ
jgi:hypothetical protein